MLPHGNAAPQWNVSMYFHWDFIIDSNINNMIEVIYLFEVFIVV